MALCIETMQHLLVLILARVSSFNSSRHAVVPRSAYPCLFYSLLLSEQLCSYTRYKELGFLAFAIIYIQYHKDTESVPWQYSIDA